MSVAMWGRVGGSVMTSIFGAMALHAQPVDPMAPLPAPVARSAATPATVPPVTVPPAMPGVAPPAVAQEIPPPPPPPPPLVWQAQDATALVDYLRTVDRDGLNPADYTPDGLAVAIRGGDPLTISAAATERFNRISSDLALGHVRRDAREDWHVPDGDLDSTRQRALAETALAQHRVAAVLDGLLPTHPQYGALRNALSLARPNGPDYDRIRLNMDRWRWLPRELGPKYIIVNVPSYHATLVQDGVTRWKHRAIAGKITTPTPQLSALATGVILNPWWEVPVSISKEAAGKPGFVAVKGADGKIQRWRQPPGPSNALGQLKFVMQNPYAIYLHDTNARSRFNSDVRALSHGCIRTENVVDLATSLLGDDGGLWDAAKVQETLDSKKSVQANFVKPLPVYIVYFSVAALTDGSIIDYDDVYRRDKRVIVAMLDRNGRLPPELALPIKPASGSARPLTAKPGVVKPPAKSPVAKSPATKSPTTKPPVVQPTAAR